MTSLHICFVIVIALCFLWGAFYIGVQVGRDREFERLSTDRSWDEFS